MTQNYKNFVQNKLQAIRSDMKPGCKRFKLWWYFVPIFPTKMQCFEAVKSVEVDVWKVLQVKDPVFRYLD